MMIMSIIPQKFYVWCKDKNIDETDMIFLWRSICITDALGQENWVKMPEEMRWSYARLKYNERKHELFAREN